MAATFLLAERARTTTEIVLLSTVAIERGGWAMLRKEE